MVATWHAGCDVTGKQKREPSHFETNAPLRYREGRLMRQVDTVSRNLPVPIDLGTRQSFFGRGDRGTPRTEFLSQLIAERHHMAPQRIKRQATPLEVLRTYDASGTPKILRIPPGYRTNIEA
jgi:hypothetical protein